MLSREEELKKIIRKYQKHAKEQGLKLNPDKKVVQMLAMGLLENKKKYREFYCPCRRIVGDRKQDKAKICPCASHKQDIKKHGRCFCGLFVK